MGLLSGLGWLVGIGSSKPRQRFDSEPDRPLMQPPGQALTKTIPNPGEWLRRPAPPAEPETRKRRIVKWQSPAAYSDGEGIIRVIRVPISDYREVEAQDGGRSIRVKGLYFYLSERENYRLQPEPVVLMRDPMNPHEEDGRAIVMARPDGRQIGFVPRSSAGTYAFYLDFLGPILVQTSRRAGSKMWVHLPPAAEMDKILRATRAEGNPPELNG